MKEIRTGIYRITSPENKIYIGATLNIDKRIGDYFNLNCKSQTKIYNSLLEFGPDNHIFEIIELCAKEELDEKERYWQDFYNVLENGLNSYLKGTLTKPGVVGEDSKKALSIAHTGKVVSDATKEKLRIHNLGKIVTTRIIQKLDLNENLLEEYINTRDAAKKNNIPEITMFRLLKAKGIDLKYIWKYKDETEEEKSRRLNCIVTSRATPIIQYNSFGKFIREWDTIKEASESLNINREAIAACIKGRSKTSGGFKWKSKQ